MEKIEKNFNANIFRHGATEYEQGETTIEEAGDLTEKGIEEIKARAEELAELIRPEEEVAIWSSPSGRALHTAKLIAETLEQKGVNLRKKGEAEDFGIKVFKQLSEVKNFSWNLFNSLITGGEIELAGKKFFIDKNLTNPRDIKYPEYFINDEIKNITPEAKTQLPPCYVQEIEGMEKFVDATRRIMKPLSRLKKLKDKSYRVIIVTHDALTGFIANVFSSGEQSGLNPGEFINLERREGKLIATKVGKSEEGDTNTDVVEEFNRRHNK